MSDVTFEDNSATFGGACYFYSHSHATIQNGIIAENSAYMGGGILMDEESQALINNVIIADNSATEFGGMGFEQQSSAILTNTIMWNNSPEEIKFSTGGVGSNEITISYSDIRGGEAGVVTNNSGIVNWLEGNINEDPLFTGSSEHPYALFDGSPCIDTGTPDTTGLNLPYVDIMGNERIWDGDGDGIAVVDMGAYEFGSIPVGMEKPAVGSQQLAVSSYPNPFHDYTTFKYELNENEAVTVSIFDHLGQMVAEPLNAYQSKGEQQCEWNPVNLPAGIYFYRIQAGKQVGSGKMVKN
jgi:hypothetical protein